MLVRRNLARTTQPARPVLQTEITNVCVFPDLLAIIVKTVGNFLTQLSKRAVKKGSKCGCCWLVACMLMLFNGHVYVVN